MGGKKKARKGPEGKARGDNRKKTRGKRKTKGKAWANWGGLRGTWCCEQGEMKNQGDFA